jgi:hypothetical protein
MPIVCPRKPPAHVSVKVSTSTPGRRRIVLSVLRSHEAGNTGRKPQTGNILCSAAHWLFPAYGVGFRRGFVDF